MLFRMEVTKSITIFIRDIEKYETSTFKKIKFGFSILFYRIFLNTKNRLIYKYTSRKVILITLQIT